MQILQERQDSNLGNDKEETLCCTDRDTWNNVLAYRSDLLKDIVLVVT
jgi:hypothetical protein